MRTHLTIGHFKAYLILTLLILSFIAIGFTAGYYKFHQQTYEYKFNLGKGDMIDIVDWRTPDTHTVLELDSLPSFVKGRHE